LIREENLLETKRAPKTSRGTSRKGTLEDDGIKRKVGGWMKGNKENSNRMQNNGV